MKMTLGRLMYALSRPELPVMSDALRARLKVKYPDCYVAPPWHGKYPPAFKLKVLYYVQDNPCLSLREVAHRHGINVRTIYRWTTKKEN